jgi:hypothetical protein
MTVLQDQSCFLSARRCLTVHPEQMCPDRKRAGTGHSGIVRLDKANSQDPAQPTDAMGGAWKIHFRFECFGLVGVG